MTSSTAVFPSKYYFEEMEGIDPRFYVEKDLIVLVPYEVQEVPPPEKAVVLTTSFTSKTLMLVQDITFEEQKKPNNNYKKKKT